MRAFRSALALLTRLPGGLHPDGDQALGRALPWFPAVGVVVGLLTALVYVPLAEVLPPLTAAALAVGFSAVVTGGFHEDGVADTADALAGGRDAAERLRLLKDPRHGTFGVLALVVVTLVKVSALASVSGAVAVAALVAAGALGRSATVAVLGWTTPVGAGGLGQSYRRSLTGQDLGLALGLGAAVGTLALGPLLLPTAALVGAAAWAVAWWAGRRIGGTTGDVLGAAEQAGECAVLVLVSAIAPGTVWFA